MAKTKLIIVACVVSYPAEFNERYQSDVKNKQDVCIPPKKTAANSLHCRTVYSISSGSVISRTSSKTIDTRAGRAVPFTCIININASTSGSGLDGAYDLPLSISERKLEEPNHGLPAALRVLKKAGAWEPFGKVFKGRDLVH